MAMDDSEVARQIRQMTQFIKQEAEEKANEIMVAAEEEFNIEKLQMVESEKQRIRKEFERKEKQVAVKKKIEYSTKLNQSRLRVLRAQDEAVNLVLQAASTRLQEVTKDPTQYKKLLTELLVQGFKKLQTEGNVTVRCRECDEAAVSEAIEVAKKTYGGANGGKVPTVALQKETFLAPPPGPGNAGESCTGGVVLAAQGGKIYINNTLDARLAIAQEANLPLIRQKLFGAAA